MRDIYGMAASTIETRFGRQKQPQQSSDERSSSAPKYGVGGVGGGGGAAGSSPLTSDQGVARGLPVESMAMGRSGVGNSRR